MKNRHTLYALHFLFLLFIIIGAHAQNITPGYYRVTNVGLSSFGGTVKGKTVKEECYAYVANGTYHMATGSGAKQNIQSMQMWTGLDNAIVSPQTVVYIAKSGDNYNLEAQGTSLSQMTSYKIVIGRVSGTTDTYTLTTTVSGVNASLWVEKEKTGRFNMQGDMAYPTNYRATTTSQGAEAYRQWKLVPISSSSANYVAVNASLEANGKYYAPYYASYPFKLVSSGMKVYYVNGISKTKYALKEITSEVIPAKTPVIIECSSNNPAECKIEPLYGNYGSVSGNKLKGVYFCNLSMSPSEYPDCRTEFKAESMRVWAVKDGQLILTNKPDKTRAVPPFQGSSSTWLRANESYLANVPSTAAEDLIPAGAATTISFNSNGGTEVDPISGEEGEPVVAPANPTRTGYSFTGWNPALPSVFPATDMSVTAQWQINKYTITFDTDGGTEVKPITQDYQSAISAPANPTKDGYTFAGWDKTIPELMPAENITIKALWTTNKYTISFETDGGTTVAPITQDYGTAITFPSNPTKEGYTFMGWDKDVPSTMPAGNVTIKAVWKINQYTITFDTDGGSEVKPITQDYGTAVTAPANPTKEGFGFAGWDKEIPAIMPAENVTIKALWKIGQYTITFDTDGGSEVKPITQDYGTAITVPANPTKEGYTFNGWDKDVPSTMPASNITIKAIWGINQYTITFDTDGGSEVKPITQDYGTAVTAPANPTKEGFGFAGWDKTIPNLMPAENVTIKALWQINQYTITFDTDGGTTVAPISGDYGSAVTAPANPTKEGYTFNGWDKDVPSTMPASNVTIKAIWGINQYTITFDTDGGSEVKPITQEYGSAVTAPANPTKEGSVFAGWNKAIPGTMPAENIIIKALWNKLYTLTFNTDGGSDVASITAVSGTSIVKPADPTKTGYTFDGWTPSVPSEMPEGNMTVKATWTINKHKVTFKNYNGDTWQEETLEYGATITPPATEPTKPGAVFKNWSPIITPETKVPDEDVVYTATFDDSEYTITFDTDGGAPVPNSITDFYHKDITDRTKDIQEPKKDGYTFERWEPAIPSIMTGDMTIKAIWKINQYTITFDTDGGSEVKAITQDYQSAIVKPADPDKEGYTFIGWNPALPEKMPLNGLSTKAQWQINKHTLTYYVDNEVYKTIENIEYATPITALAEPKNEGYTFSGWSTIPPTMPDNNFTVTGTFSINQYTITFDTDGGSEVNPITQDYNSVIAVPTSVPVKEGYTFIGWNPALPEKMPAENKTVTAQWQKNKHTLTYYVDNEVYETIEDVEYDTPITALAEPKKEGYTFSGWSTIPPTMPDNNFTVTGTFSINQYTITFDTDGGSEVAPITQDYQSAIVKPDDPAREGYTFIGWNPALPEKMPAENKTVTAQWQINKHTLTYFVDGKVYMTIEDIDYNTPITPETEPVKIGYKFSGWSAIPSTMPDNNVNVTGTFSINQYTITFDTDGGSEVAPITQDYQSAIVKPDDPAREGYTFIGWNPALPETMPLDGFSTKAQWQINKHNITYYVDGEEYKKLEDVEYNTPITPETEPTKKGYTFSHWSAIPSTMPDRDVNVTGTFSINQYTITFDADGGSEVKAITQDYQSAISKPADPTKEGYDFAGWNPELPETMPDEDLNLTAIWGPKTREETYDFNEGWTWVSFTMMNEEMKDLGTVLSSLKWTSTDEIKGADVWGIYSAKKGKWIGYLEGFNEVTMYKIHSSVDQQLTLKGSYQNSKGKMSLSVGKGWNYLAYLSLDELPVEVALQNYAASEGDVLKSQTASAEYTEGEWKGTLTTMEPRKGYMLKRIADDAVSFTYPIAAPTVSNEARASRFTEAAAQRFSSNMTVFAEVEGVMSMPGDSIVAFAIDGVRGGATIDNEGKACLTIIGDNKADIYLTLLHNNEIVATANAPIQYVSDDIMGSYANPAPVLFTEGADAWSNDYNVKAIYSMDGKCLPTTDVKTLTTGLYIIKYETLSDNNSNTGGCRVIRVVQ